MTLLSVCEGTRKTSKRGSVWQGGTGGGVWGGGGEWGEESLQRLTRQEWMDR